MAEGLKIDKDLNLVVTVERADGSEVHAHCVPLPLDVFKQHFMTLSGAFSQIFGRGMAFASAAGPRVAWLTLEKIGRQEGEWDGGGLCAHISRLCTVLAPDGKGAWASMLLTDAVAQKIIDEEDALEVQGVVAFFICVSAVARRGDRRQILDLSLPIWGGRTTSSTVTEFQRSLPMSTAVVRSGVKVASSVPR